MGVIAGLPLLPMGSEAILEPVSHLPSDAILMQLIYLLILQASLK